MAKRRQRRKPGTGYTTQAKNKTWSAFYPKFGGGYHVRKGFDTRQNAEAWLDALNSQRTAKVDIGKGQQRVDTWIDAWATRAAKERGWKAKMIADVQWKLGYVKPYIGAMALADVLPDHVDMMIDELAESLAETTIRQIRNYLFQVFKSAIDRRYITYNPVIKPERRKRAKQQEPERLTAPQATVLLRAAAGSFQEPAWWLIICLGLRAGEICGLRRGDVDLQHATLTVSQQMTDVRGEVTRETPKGDKVRTIPIPRSLVPMLEQHIEALTRRAAQGTQKGYWREHSLIFPGRGGRAMNPTSLRHALKRLTDACHMPPIKTHNLRHTAGGLLTSVGAPENITAAILGHAPSSITRHYAPPDVETMRPWVEKVYGVIVGGARKAQTG